LLFLKPFQTFYREEATFYANELVLSTINRTVPLEGALGRAWVISPELFARGRPVGCLEEDVWVVEHQYTPATQKWKLLSAANKSHLTEDSHLFRSFKAERPFARTHRVKGASLVRIAEPKPPKPVRAPKPKKDSPRKQGSTKRKASGSVNDGAADDGDGDGDGNGDAPSPSKRKRETRALNDILTSLLLEGSVASHVTKSGRAATVRTATEPADLTHLLVHRKPVGSRRSGGGRAQTDA
jgi:hypothetical protein